MFCQLVICSVLSAANAGQRARDGLYTEKCYVIADVTTWPPTTQFSS